MLTLPRSIYNPESGPNRNQHSSSHSKKCYLHSIPAKKTLSFHFKCSLWRIAFNISKIQSWTKMLRKMHVVCLILEYFPLKSGSLKILPPPPQKNNVEVWPEHFCCLLNNTDQGGVGGGITMVPNSQGRSPVCRKEQNS